MRNMNEMREYQLVSDKNFLEGGNGQRHKGSKTRVSGIEKEKQEARVLGQREAKENSDQDLRENERTC